MTPIRIHLKALREARGLSQVQLSELSGVRQATISEIEGGKAGPDGSASSPRLVTFERLADALEVSLHELIEHLPAKRKSRGTRS